MGDGVQGNAQASALKSRRVDENVLQQKLEQEHSFEGTPNILLLKRKLFERILGTREAVGECLTTNAHY